METYDIFELFEILKNREDVNKLVSLDDAIQQSILTGDLTLQDLEIEDAWRNDFRRG